MNNGIILLDTKGTLKKINKDENLFAYFLDFYIKDENQSIIFKYEIQYLNKIIDRLNIIVPDEYIFIDINKSESNSFYFNNFISEDNNTNNIKNYINLTLSNQPLDFNLDILLDKINENGIESLNKFELEFLNNAR